jgi:hypothetical protein
VPLLWTQGQPEETIRRAVGEVADSGNTGFVWESRPHPDYLGPRWWADLGVVLDEARLRELEVWIFDEWMYPSGIAGGKVVQNNPEFSLHTVSQQSMELSGPRPESQYDITVPLAPNQRLVSVAACRAKFDPLPMTPAPGAASVAWAVPEGRWRLVWSYVTVHPTEPGWSMANMIDVMNPAATAEFLRLTHDATYAHFRDYFGNTLRGFFSDETGFRNVTSYESLPGKPDMPMPWSPVLPDLFRRAKGYELAPWLPALWFDLGPSSRRVRFDFVDVCSRAFAENFFKPQQVWCRAHGVRFIGHLVEDNHADHNLGYGPGHWFRSTRYFDMPGIDIVGYQVTPGVDAGGVPWTPGSTLLWDQEHFQFGLPAMARGAALLQGAREIFSEAFGAYGWSQGLRMLEWVGQWHIVNGIGVLSPHAFTMKHNDPDCPAHFNRMSGNPQWRHYRHWSEPFQRLQRIVLSTDPAYDAAVLYTAESAWVGQAQNVAPVARTLETSQVSTVVLPYEALDAAAKLPAIVLPMVRYIPAEVATFLADAADGGKRVIVCETWPSASVDARGDDQVRAAVERLKACPNATLAPTPEITAHIPAPKVTLDRACPSLVTSRRRSPAGEDWLILHNRSVSMPVRARLTWRGAAGTPVLYDPSTDSWRAVSYRPSPVGIEIDIDIPVYGLWCLRAARQQPKTTPLPTVRASEELNLRWQAARAAGDTGLAFESPAAIDALSDWRRWPGMAAYAGTVRYRAVFEIAKAAPFLALDLGRVEEIAEASLNGRALGVRICPPYFFDITAAARPGANELIVDVTNTAYARWKDNFSHGDAASGLFGPVRLLRD